MVETMKKINKIIALLLLSLLTSCYQDEGNYDYNAINEVNITGLPESEVVYFRNSDTLRATPTIEGTIDKDLDENYTYVWEAISYNPMEEKLGTTTQIGTEKNLNYFITLPDGNYKVYLKVQDHKTKVIWRSAFPIKVTNIIKEGWLILQDNKGMTRLDMVSLPSANQEIMLRDLLSKSDFKYGKGPRKIITLADMYINYDMARIAIMTDEGTTHLNTSDLAWDETMDYIYEFGASLDKIVGNNIVYWYMTGFNMFISDADVYLRTGYPVKLYIAPINHIDGVPIKISEHVGTLIAPYSQATVFYDETNQQFVQLVSTKSFTPCKVEEKVFANKTSRNMVYMGNTYHDKGRCYGLLKGSDMKLWLYAFKIVNGSSFAQVDKYHYEIDAPQIDKAIHFAFHPTLFYMFYATEDKVYQYDLVTKNCKELKLESGAVGEKISFLKFNMFTKRAQEAKCKELQDLLIVGSYKESDGFVRLYSVDSDFSKEANVYKSYNNFAKPIDITYKEI